MNCIVMIYKLLISLAALGTRRARAKRGIAFFISFIWYSALVCLTLNKFGCTRHSQGESQEGCTILYKFHLVFCARLLNFK